MNSKVLCCVFLLLLLLVAQDRLGAMSAAVDRVGSSEPTVEVEQLLDMTTPGQHMEPLESKEEDETEKAVEQMGSETDKPMDRESKEEHENEDVTQPTETETEMGKAEASDEAATAVEMENPKESTEVEAEAEPPAGMDKPKESHETEQSAVGAQDDAATETDRSQEAKPAKAEKSAEEEQVTPANVEPVEQEPTEAAQLAGEDYQNDEAASAAEAIEAAATTEPAAPTAAKVDSPAMPAMANVCYSCSSYRNGSCLREPTERQNCPANAKQDGCYTLYKRETRLIMRGCSSDLKEEGHKYCLKEAKLCKLCRGQLCNRDVADVAAAAGQLVASLTVWCVCLLAALLQCQLHINRLSVSAFLAWID